MLKALKSYWAFTNGAYKLMMLVVVPVILVAGYMLSIDEYAGNSLVLLIVLFFVDTASDFFFMNGFYRKGNNSLEFLQSSSRFPKLMKEVSGVDIVRRVLVYQIPFVLELIYASGSDERLQWCRFNAFWPWLAILMAQLVVFVARHFLVWHQVYLCTVIGYVVFMIGFLMISILGDGTPVITNAFLMTIIIILGGITIGYTEKKAKESYYD